MRRPSTSEAGRWARWAALLVTVAALATAVLVTTVNPLFRDAAVDVDRLRSAALICEAGNALRMACVAGAAACLLAWRRRI